jgi:hypothetical protein
MASPTKPSGPDRERTREAGATGERKRSTRRRAGTQDLDPAGGRLWIPLIFLVAMVLFPWSPLGGVVDVLVPKKAAPTNTRPGDWKIGSSGVIKVSVVTADYASLDCASEQELNGKRCDYKTDAERWPRKPDQPLDDNKRDIIQPYRTWPHNDLIAVAGLWAEPAVAMRLHQEPIGNTPREKLARFVVECEADFVGKLAAPRLRWFPTQAWQKEPSDVVVAVPKSCKLAPSE